MPPVLLRRIASLELASARLNAANRVDPRAVTRQIIADPTAMSLALDLWNAEQTGTGVMAAAERFAARLRLLHIYPFDNTAT